MEEQQLPAFMGNYGLGDEHPAAGLRHQAIPAANWEQLQAASASKWEKPGLGLLCSGEEEEKGGFLSAVWAQFGCCDRAPLWGLLWGGLWLELGPCRSWWRAWGV